MPVEIRELVIRAITNLDAKNSEDKSELRVSPIDQEAIIRECVKQVMSLLKQKEER